MFWTGLIAGMPLGIILLALIVGGIATWQNASWNRRMKREARNSAKWRSGKHE